MTIQWFPGHMTRARRQIEEKLKLIDLAIELLDARVPLSSRNPMIDQILKGKPRLVLLNKQDLADPKTTSDWVEYFKEQGLEALPIDASSGTGVRELVPKSRALLAEKIEAQRARGVNPRSVRALIVGIPNVGKSTLINRLAGRKVAITGDKPGVTKGQQWIKTQDGLDLLDTPGILWPKFEDQAVGVRLAATGAIRDEVLHAQDVVFYTLKYLAPHYAGELNERYQLGIEPDKLDLDNPDDVVALMEGIGRKRGCLISGGRVDLEKASQLFLRDLRDGKLGRISLEHPGELG
ncbi:ribosome biogenesis GTPase YlqF [Gorillibacterium timonense]|uniref:ribosome biogenesis GTPase YlqF n=1 Tax=Gorillibacterium timonense TaxID=1689269 RepID=UPI00071D61D7|nr:ribosome biogenesis GTPase YlqF [Gorillibacterium timonense]